MLDFFFGSGNLVKFLVEKFFLWKSGKIWKSGKMDKIRTIPNPVKIRIGKVQQQKKFRVFIKIKFLFLIFFHFHNLNFKFPAYSKSQINTVDQFGEIFGKRSQRCNKKKSHTFILTLFALKTPLLWSDKFFGN